MERAIGVQPHKTPHFNSRHRYTPAWNDSPKKSLGPAQPPPHWCRTFPLLPVQMGYGDLCVPFYVCSAVKDHVTTYALMQKVVTTMRVKFSLARETITLSTRLDSNTA